jgi:hypothetical protein
LGGEKEEIKQAIENKANDETGKRKKEIKTHCNRK